MSNGAHALQSRLWAHAMRHVWRAPEDRRLELINEFAKRMARVWTRCVLRHPERYYARPAASDMVIAG